MPRRSGQTSARGTRLQSILSGTTFVTNPSGVTIDGTTGVQVASGLTVTRNSLYPTYHGTDAYIFERGVADSANNGVAIVTASSVLAVTLSNITTCYGVFPSIQFVSTGSSVVGSSVSTIVTSFSGSGVTFSCFDNYGARKAINAGTSIQYLAFGV